MLGRLKGIVFDMDGTLVESCLDFALIRDECGAPAGTPLLEFIESAPEADRKRMHTILDRHEREAAMKCTLRDGATEVLDAFASTGHKLALLTRNSAESVRVVLRRFRLSFDCWLSRHDAAPKPSPEPVLRIAERLGLCPTHLLVVGDYIFDVQSGHAAGARTAFLRTPKLMQAPPETDIVIDDLRDLLRFVPPTAR